VKLKRNGLQITKNYLHLSLNETKNMYMNSFKPDGVQKRMQWSFRALDRLGILENTILPS
jgi:hypothetical protein